MNSLEREVEAMILQFFQSKDNIELKKIQCGRDVSYELDENEEVIYEIKDRLWYLLQQRIRWYYLADSIKDMVDHTQDTDEEDEAEAISDDDQNDAMW